MIKKLSLVMSFLLVVLGVTGISAQEDLCNIELETMTTADGVEFVRIPDACFENLLDWDYDPQYVEIDGLRQAYVDVGTGESGETILLLHGQPAWSYLYRRMIPVLAEEGHRVIAMDHVGMGRSDKPIDLDYYSYLNHVERLEVFIQELELEGITAFVQDWGSLIGLNVIGNNPELFDRVVLGNGTLPREDTVPSEAMVSSINNLFESPDIVSNLGDQFFERMSNTPANQPPLRDENGQLIGDVGDAENFLEWMAYARFDERFRASQILENSTYFALTPEELEAYDAPFPARIAMAGIRIFPSLSLEVQGTTDSAWEGLRSYNEPFLTIIGNNDPLNLGSVENQNYMIENIPGAEGQEHTRLIDAGHFLQDDKGEEIAELVLAFIAQTSD